MSLAIAFTVGVWVGSLVMFFIFAILRTAKSDDE